MLCSDKPRSRNLQRVQKQTVIYLFIRNLQRGSRNVAKPARFDVWLRALGGNIPLNHNLDVEKMNRII